MITHHNSVAKTKSQSFECFFSYLEQQRTVGSCLTKKEHQARQKIACDAKNNGGVKIAGLLVVCCLECFHVR